MDTFTFYANPDETNEPWFEKAGIKGYGFRVWHYIFFCFVALTVLVVLLCCCIKFRIPRTKQEIEADYRRKQLAEKFRKRLRLIQNQEMDALDLQKALEIIQKDYKREQHRDMETETTPLQQPHTSRSMWERPHTSRSMWEREQQQESLSVSAESSNI